MALEGSLSDFGLADILQLIYFQKKTGILTLDGKMDRVKLYFTEGNIAGAESRKRTDSNRVGKILVKKGLISDEDLRSALEEQRKTEAKIGNILLSRDLVNKELIKEALNSQVTETVVQLFGWKEGSYEFAAQAFTQDKEFLFSIDTQHLLMEGLRIVDEWTVIKDKITLDIVFHKKAEPESDLSVEEEDILRHVDGENDVSTIIDLSEKDNFEVSKILLSLMEKGIIEAEVAAPVFTEPVTLKTGKSSVFFNLLTPLVVLFSLALAIVVVLRIDQSDFVKKFEAARKIEDLRFRIETYRLEHSEYPQSLELISDSKDPWGMPYLYRLKDNSFFLSSSGADNKEGTPDDIY